MNPWQQKTSTELCAGADDAAAAQGHMAAASQEDSEHWHHAGLAWLLIELATRLRNAEHALTKIYDGPITVAASPDTLSAVLDTMELIRDVIRPALEKSRGEG